MSNEHQTSLPDIRHTLVLHAPIEKVWNAVSTAEGISAWFMPNDFQPVLGFEFSLNAGQFGTSHCKVTELEPPHRLAFSWGEQWQVTFELKELDGKTEFTLIHSGWDVEKTTQFGETHTVVRDRMDQGWGSSVLARLQKLVEA